jgi:hypothetical protein
MAENYQAPPYGLIGLGQISYQSQTYLYSRILSIYGTTGTLPTTITLKSWNVNNIPILDTPSVTFTPAEIAAAATKLKNTIETTKNIPNTITINGITIYTAQFLHLAVQAIVQLNKDNNTAIRLRNGNSPSYSEESLRSGVLFQEDYVDFAQRIDSYMDNNEEAPPYGWIGLGKISYQSQIYLFTRILNYYNLKSVLPDNIAVKSWNSQNIPITAINVNFTIAQIALTANGVKNNVEIYKSLPEFAEVGGLQVNIAQFLYLSTTAVMQIKNNDNTPIPLKNYNLPDYCEEQINSGNLSQAEYLDFAQRILDYMDDNQEAPAYGLISLGKISFQSQVYLYSRILNSYRTSSTLPPVSNTIGSWLSILYNIPSGYTQYCVPTANCQSNDARIIALANNISINAFSNYDKAVLIYNWVRNNTEYEFYLNTSKGAVGTMNSRGGNCVDLTHLLVALCRASGLPARYVYGNCYFTTSGIWYGHVWANIYVNNQWIWADASNNRNEFGVINNWNTGSFSLKGTYTSLPF